MKSVHQPTHDTDDHHSTNRWKTHPPMTIWHIWPDPCGWICQVQQEESALTWSKDVRFYRMTNRSTDAWQILMGWWSMGRISTSMAVSNIFYAPPYVGKISNLTTIFQMGWNHQLATRFFLHRWLRLRSFSQKVCGKQLLWTLKNGILIWVYEIILISLCRISSPTNPLNHQVSLKNSGQLSIFLFLGCSSKSWTETSRILVLDHSRRSSKAPYMAIQWNHVVGGWCFVFFGNWRPFHLGMCYCI